MASDQTFYHFLEMLSRSVGKKKKKFHKFIFCFSKFEWIVLLNTICKTLQLFSLQNSANFDR